jgi:WD40 repeat protein
LSLIELKNGELISGGRDGTLRRWRDGKPVGDGKPIDTGQGWVRSLIELKNGELISGGGDGTLRRWRTTPGWQSLLPLACSKLEHHPTLTSLPWFNAARATCEHFVWRHRRLFEDAMRYPMRYPIRYPMR